MSTSVTPFSGHRSGDTIDGKYQLDHLAGEGSTGEVWLATNTTLDMPVALKLLRRKGRPQRDGAPTLGERFNADLLREAQATARVTHASIVRVFDFGMTDAGDPFIVMERLEGEDLRDKLLRDGPCPLVHAVQLVLPVIHGMQAAHVRGIVHRDLKPENIYLAVDDSGRALPKIVDFGIANLPWEKDEKLIVGTPAYMAPEQAAGKERSDFRADIYSIVVVLYELIAGYTPASYRNWPDCPNRGRDDDDDGIDCLVREETIDAPLAAILRRGLMRHPAARHRSMRELGEALAAWLLDRGVEVDVQGVLLSSNWLCDASRGAEPTRSSARPIAAPPGASTSSTSPPGPMGIRAVTPRARATPAFGRMRLLVAAPLVLLAAGGAVGVAFAARTSEDAHASAPATLLDEARTESPPTTPPRSRAAVSERESTAAPLYDTRPPAPPLATSTARSSGATPAKAVAPVDNTSRRASPPPVIGLAKHPAPKPPGAKHPATTRDDSDAEPELPASANSGASAASASPSPSSTSSAPPGVDHDPVAIGG